MPTLRENIAYLYRHLVYPRRAIIKHIAGSVLAILVIALLLEVFVFNFNYFATAGYNPINLSEKIDLGKTSAGDYRITERSNTLEFNNLNTEVDNVYVWLDPSQPGQNLDVKIQFTDEAHLRYFDSTEYTEGIPIVQMSTYSQRSQYVNLNATGIVNSLKISFQGEASYPILLKTVMLNAHRPFLFVWWRFMAVFVVLLLAFAFRPSSAVYRILVNEHPKSTRAAISIAVALECVLLAAYVFFGSNLVGVATSSYNYGSWDGESIVNTFEVGGDNAQQYAELAKSFTKGHFYLDQEPPEWLVEMDSPYDKGARDELQKETGEDYLFDVAYFDGKYYVYFGVVPVFLFYLPFYLLTGANFPTAVGVMIALLAFVLGVSALLDRFARQHFRKVSLGLYLLMQIAIVACSGILYLAKFPTFYSLPLACGLAFSVWGLYFWVCGRSQPEGNVTRRRVCFAAGSLCMALVAGCRPQLLVMSLLAIPLFWRKYIVKRSLLSKRGAADFACLVAPYIAVGSFIMYYNAARFGSPFDFGANYNLTLNDMTQRGWVLGRFAPAFFAYFVQTPNTTGTFPFIQTVDFSTTYMGQTIKEATFGGILACYPVLWVLFFAIPIVRIRNKSRDTKTVSGVIGVLVVSAIVVAMVDAQMAGILQRYYADFSFLLLAATVLLVFIVNESLVAPPISPSEASGVGTGGKGACSCGGCSAKGVWRRLALSVAAKRSEHSRRKSILLGSSDAMMRDILTKVLIALVSLSVLYAILLCFVPEVGWYSNAYPWAFQDILETISFWK